MSIITVSGLSARTPDGKTLFENLDLAFGRERTGLVGRNGSGKSTLLRLIAGDQSPQAGAVAVRGRIAALRQVVGAGAGRTLSDILGATGPLAVLARVEAGQGGEADFAVADWTLPARLESALASVGLAGFALDRPASDLSGGEAARAALAAVLLAEPDMILLDEPTNHLDAEARAAVSEILATWRGGAIIASHDRSLLRGMDRIVELSGLGARVYGGGYDLYAERKAEEEAAAKRGLAEAERELAKINREAQAARERQARRDGAGKRMAAKGGVPKIVLGAMAERAENTGAKGERMAERQKADAQTALETARERVERMSELGFALPPSGLAAGRTVLRFDRVGVRLGGRPVISDLDLAVTGPERIAITGPNGSGKTTLLRLAAGDLAPDEGAVTRNGLVALLDQRIALLHDGETLAEAYLRLNPRAGRNQAQAALARFLFRNVAAEKAVGALSGGERLRAALACMLMGDAPPQLLILDEPTNHLDLASLGAVEAALRGYDGALLVVSHDEDFLAAIGVDRRLALTPGGSG